MKRAQIDAFCGCRETLYQRIAFFAAPAILLAGIVYVAVRYAQLPAEIPSHYNFYGEIDGYGSRGTLWITPVIGITLPFFSYGGSSLLTTFAAMGLVSGVKYKPKPQLFSMMY
jgi:uncharacterized membrane protein